MTPDELQHAWVKQALLDAERGVIECRMCGGSGALDQTITLWRNGTLVFAVCDRCAGSHDILMRPTEAGIEVRARRRSPLVLGGAAS